MAAALAWFTVSNGFSDLYKPTSGSPSVADASGECLYLAQYPSMVNLSLAYNTTGPSHNDSLVGKEAVIYMYSILYELLVALFEQ